MEHSELEYNTNMVVFVLCDRSGCVSWRIPRRLAPQSSSACFIASGLWMLEMI